MAEWNVDSTSRAGVLKLALRGSISLDDMHAFVKAHNDAIRGFGTKPYRVFCDLRGLHPMSQECTELFTSAKKVSSGRATFRGSAVVVDAKFVGLQHRRTSAEAGLAQTELITEDEGEAWSFLETVERSVAKA